MRFQAFLTFLALCGVVLAMNSTDDKFFGYEEVLTETIRNDVYSTANIYITKTGFVPVHTSVPIIQSTMVYTVVSAFPSGYPTGMSSGYIPFPTSTAIPTYPNSTSNNAADATYSSTPQKPKMSPESAAAHNAVLSLASTAFALLTVVLVI